MEIETFRMMLQVSLETYIRQYKTLPGFIVVYDDEVFNELPRPLLVQVATASGMEDRALDIYFSDTRQDFFSLGSHLHDPLVVGKPDPPKRKTLVIEVDDITFRAKG